MQTGKYSIATPGRGVEGGDWPNVGRRWHNSPSNGKTLPVGRCNLKSICENETRCGSRWLVKVWKSICCQKTDRSVNNEYTSEQVGFRWEQNWSFISQQNLDVVERTTSITTTKTATIKRTTMSASGLISADLAQYKSTLKYNSNNNRYHQQHQEPYNFFQKHICYFNRS